MKDKRNVYAVLNSFERLNEDSVSKYKPRVITASYPGSFCKICHGEIKKGEEITKAVNGGYRHATCGESPFFHLTANALGYEPGLRCVMCNQPLEINDQVQSYGSGCFQHARCPKDYGGKGEPPWKRAQENKVKKETEEFPARYPGRCCKCDGHIEVGQRITGSSGQFHHIQCPPTAKAANNLGGNQQNDKRSYRLGSGYVSQPPSVEQTVRLPKNLRSDGGMIAVITKVDSQYIRDDGLSFGVGDDSGYVWTVHYRLASEDEERKFLAKEEVKKNRSQAEKDMQGAIVELEKLAWSSGKHQYGSNDQPLPFPDGKVIFKDERGMLYGSGRWIVKAADGTIWFIRNNGADGDDWSQNNIKTGGAGAVGWELKNNAEAERLISKIETLHLALVGPNA